MIDVMGIPGAVGITGASGFLGSRLCAALAAAEVGTRALVRRPGALSGAGVEEVVSSFADAAGIADALRGIHTVVHLAARAHVLREPQGDSHTRFRDVNVALTQRLLDGAAAAGVVRVVYLSSIGAVATTTDADVTDATPATPDTAYGRSKLEAEAAVRAQCERDGLSYVILRPPMVYGPGMKGNPLRLFRAIARGLPLPVAGATNRRSTMYVDNLVAAIVASLRLPLGTRQTFVVGDSEPMSTASLAREIGEALGRPARLVTVPRWLIRTGALVGDTVSAVVPFPLTSVTIERLFGSLAVDYTRFAQTANYRPPIARADAMHRTAEWFKEAH